MIIVTIKLLLESLPSRSKFVVFPFAVGEASTGAFVDGLIPAVGAYIVGAFVVVFTMFSTGTEDGASVASPVGTEVGVCEVGTNHGGSVACTIGIGANVIEGFSPMLGAIVVGVGSIVGTGGTLIEYTVGEADGKADGSTPGMTLMICPCATSVCCRPISRDHINRH